MATTAWTREHVADLTDSPTPVIESAAPLVEGLDLWDPWPFRRSDGSVADFEGASLWAALSAPAEGDPSRRHDVARIRILSESGGTWRDHGDIFPEGDSPGSREWAGYTLVEDGRLWVAYTATGNHDEERPTYRQRIMGTGAKLSWQDGDIRLEDWSPHVDLVRADGERYLPADETEGEPGFIRAFRDPFRFVEPTVGEDQLLFSASHARSSSDYNGAIGLARASDEEEGGWELDDPLVVGDGVNNELERPHVVFQHGNVYLFFSTQRRTFHPDFDCPTGLYGFVGESLAEPLRPLNGSGLVFSNPPEEPSQAYSWMVLDDLSVVSFVDLWNLDGADPRQHSGDGEFLRRHFGGTMAPVLHLTLEGDRAYL